MMHIVSGVSAHCLFAFAPLGPSVLEPNLEWGIKNTLVESRLRGLQNTKLASLLLGNQNVYTIKRSTFTMIQHNKNYHLYV